MSETFGQLLAHLRSRRGLSLAALGALVNYTGGYLWELEHGRKHAGVELAAALDTALGANGALVTLASVDHAKSSQPLMSGDDEFDAFELARRVGASDVGTVTLTGIERAVDRLAIAYQGTPPAELLPDVRRYLRYVGELVDKRMTLAQRRRLLVAGGWLSLLGATLHIDLHQRAAAAARLGTAAALAEHAGHNEIAAWCLETQAWDALTEGEFRLAVDLSQAAQRVAPSRGSALIQATAQEGRANARLGDGKATRSALERVARLVSPLSNPEHPEHHYQYDPAKQLAYTATTLSWVADPAAESFAREVLARLESGRDGGPRPRRAASARLDLALALVGVGQLDEAASQATAALRSGRIVPSNTWRAAEILAAVEAGGLREATEFRDAYETLLRESAR